MGSAPFGYKKTALRLQSGAFILWWFATFPDLDIHAEGVQEYREYVLF